jgi:hypothetical protein
MRLVNFVAWLLVLAMFVIIFNVANKDHWELSLVSGISFVGVLLAAAMSWLAGWIPIIRRS